MLPGIDNEGMTLYDYREKYLETAIAYYAQEVLQHSWVQHRVQPSITDSMDK